MSGPSALVEAIARALVDKPEWIAVSERTTRGTTFLDVALAPEDLGRLIGRQGRTAQAIRALVAVIAEAEGRRIEVDFREGAAPERG